MSLVARVLTFSGELQITISKEVSMLLEGGIQMHPPTPPGGLASLGGGCASSDLSIENNSVSLYS